MEPMIANKSDYVLKTLDQMEKQQYEIERVLEAMEKRIGDGKYTHELSEHIIDYEDMKEEIMKLQEEGQDWDDPGNEQLVNIFENLNQVELQIKDMDRILSLYNEKLGLL